MIGSTIYSRMCARGRYPKYASSGVRWCPRSVDCADPGKACKLPSAHMGVQRGAVLGTREGGEQMGVRGPSEQGEAAREAVREGKGGRKRGHVKGREGGEGEGEARRTVIAGDGAIVESRMSVES
jgi:hypothetical protein